MEWYQYLALGTLAYCFIAFMFHFVRALVLGKPKDKSRKSGSVSKGVLYANTIAMMPANKETAYLHLPTYATGIVFHLGIFLSLLLFVLLLFPSVFQWMIAFPTLPAVLAGCLSLSTLAGLILFVKRLCKKELRVLSHGDDFVSNLSTTLFQAATLVFLCFLGGSPEVATVYYVVCAWLFFYLPLGKLRHVFYYFSARYHLGFFYGWRNVWPQK
ncbi:MAG: hypothetical protein J5873_02565 [Bacteroidales bacterium]|nr:hypothetical protein [Bacteroidales bacterium]